MNLKDALILVTVETEIALRKHDSFNSPHEGYAVIKEELDELWDEIKQLKGFWDRNEKLTTEATQIAAMAIRFLIDLCGEKVQEQ